MLRLLVLLMFVVGFARADDETGWVSRTLAHDGLTRTYGVYVPETLLADAPLVIALHPAGTSGRAMQQIAGFDAFAEDSGWLVAYPDGPGGYWDYGAGTRQWAAVPDVRDDPDFIAQMIEHIAVDWPVDRDRIYVAGYSNGGRMAFRLACDLPLAGVAVVAATATDDVTAICGEGRVPLWIQHGTADGVIPFDGKADLMLGSQRISAALGVIDTAKFFAVRNGCGDPVFTPVAETPLVVMEGVIYQDCVDDAAVEIIVAQGGGHTWAHVPDVDTAGLIWQFFEQHRHIPPEDADAATE